MDKQQTQRVRCTGEQLKNAQSVLMVGCLAEAFQQKKCSTEALEGMLLTIYDRHVELFMSNDGIYKDFDWDLI